MTQPPPLPPTPFGDDTDEALSALLDGELGAFAQDHGVTEAEARARLEQWPGYSGRLAELEQVRAAVLQPVPPLDDLARRRLVRTALPAADGIGATSKRAGWSWLRVSAAAAAALIVLAGIGAMLTSLGTGDDTRSQSASKAESSAAAHAPHGDLGNLGNVSNPASIRHLLDPGSSEPSVPPNAPNAEQLKRQSATSGAAADSAAGTQSNASTRADIAPAPPVCAAQLAGTRPVAFYGTGTYQGRPVTVVGIESGGRTIAFVVPDGDCTNVLTAISR